MIIGSEGTRVKKPKKKAKKSKKLYQLDFSQYFADIRNILWFNTIGNMLLAFYCVHKGYIGSLPWIAAQAGFPWTAYSIVGNAYMKLAASDHREGGITFETAKARNFQMEDVSAHDSPPI